MKRWMTLAALALLAAPLFFPAYAASRPPVRGKNGMVVSTSFYASDAGLEILRKGGNAVDAAVAIGFALAVVHPAAGNIGGGGFMVIHHQGEDYTVDYREMAPAAADRDMYLDEEGEVVEGLSTEGYLAAGVPGSVAGMHLAWQKFGKLPWPDVVAPAIRLAQGFEVTHALARSLKGAEKRLGKFPESRRIFLRDGDFYREGETFRQPELERTLRLIAEQGPKVFYEGEIARLIAADNEANGGLITPNDLAGYEARMREPIRGSYRGLEVVSMAPPSSGGVVLVEMLNMIESYPVEHLGLNSAESTHLKAEVMRRAFADRAQYMGDPDFSDIPVEGLISKEYAEGWNRGIRRGWASPSSMISAGEPLGYESDETTHYSVVDGAGGAVATTTTINGGYGNGVTVKGAGFLMNNEMDDFSSKPGVPNMYGVIQGEANSVGPRKRPLSSMTPTIVKKDGKPYLVLGSPGGPTIINTVFQLILNVVDFGLDIQAAVDNPRVHHQWQPDRIRIERNGLPREVLWELQRRGHVLRIVGSIGDAHSIMIDPEDGVLLGAPDPRRGDSKASGF